MRTAERCRDRPAVKHPTQQGGLTVVDGQMGSQPLNGSDAHAILGIVWQWIDDAKNRRGPDEADLQNSLEDAGYGPPAAPGSPAPINSFPRVTAGELRIGDVLTPHSDYRGDDDTLGAVCEALMRKGPYVQITWRIVATGETYTSVRNELDYVRLMRRGPKEGA